MTLEVYNRLDGEISLEDAIDIIKQIDVDYDMTISYKAERRILRAVCNGELIIQK